MTDSVGKWAKVKVTKQRNEMKGAFLASINYKLHFSRHFPCHKGPIIKGISSSCLSSLISNKIISHSSYPWNVEKEKSHKVEMETIK